MRQAKIIADYPALPERAAGVESEFFDDDSPNSWLGARVLQPLRPSSCTQSLERFRSHFPPRSRAKRASTLSAASGQLGVDAL